MRVATLMADRPPWKCRSDALRLVFLCELLNKYRNFLRTFVDYLEEYVLQYLKSIEDIVPRQLSFMASSIAEPFERH